MALPSIRNRRIVSTSLPGLERRENTETAAGSFSRRTAARSWKQVLDKDRHIYDVTIDPQDPNVLYATGFESSAWRSADRGLHWTRIPGFNFKWGHRVIPDPLHRDEVYITTFGGSVWHGSINGQQRAVDIATPVLEPGQ